MKRLWNSVSSHTPPHSPTKMGVPVASGTCPKWASHTAGMLSGKFDAYM